MMKRAMKNKLFGLKYDIRYCILDFQNMMFQYGDNENSKKFNNIPFREILGGNAVETPSQELKEYPYRLDIQTSKRGYTFFVSNEADLANWKKGFSQIIELRNKHNQE